MNIQDRQSSSRIMKRLEYFWAAHAMLGLAAALCLFVTNSPLFLVIVECLGFPLGWMIGHCEFYSLLPSSWQYALVCFALFLNGGLYYLVLRACFGKRGIVRGNADIGSP